MVKIKQAQLAPPNGHYHSLFHNNHYFTPIYPRGDELRGKIGDIFWLDEVRWIMNHDIHGDKKCGVESLGELCVRTPLDDGE